jgi:putative ABC transport system substrate-binding protein
MIRKILSCLLLTVILLTVSLVEAQQPAKVYRIGILSPGSPSSAAPNIEAFRQGLRELGYIEGKNIVGEYRYADGRPDRLPDLAAELVRLGVDVIVTDGRQAVGATKNKTSAIPIVMGAIGDPVASGIVASLARPGGNITGLTILAPELNGKRLELLKETFPEVSQVAVLRNVANPGTAFSLKETEVVAKSIGVQVKTVEVRSPDEFDGAFRAVVAARPDALITLSDAMLWNHRTRIADFAVKSRLPAMFPEKEYVDVGGLMSYAPSLPDNFRRAATYVDKILKGAKPADLPVEQPTKFEFVINLKTAKQIGLSIPPKVLVRADKEIR